MSTIFTKIINREIPANIIYEDSDVVAFLDADPATPGHTLVVPKQEFKDIFEVTPEVLNKVMAVVQKIAHAMKDTLGVTGVNIVNNSGEVALQTVFHLHIHVIPRYDRNEYGYKRPPKLDITNEETIIISKKLQKALS